MNQGDGGTDPKHETAGEEHDPLWQELAAVVTNAGAIPPEIPRAGRDSFTWRTIDAELAELAYDSVADHSMAGAMRGLEDARLLTFEAPGLTVEVEVTALGARRQLVGQLFPNRQARVMIRHQDGILTVEADELGRFWVEDLPSGPGSLRCHPGGGQGDPVVTDWFVL
jgi:hypothetical protein